MVCSQAPDPLGGDAAALSMLAISGPVQMAPHPGKSVLRCGCLSEPLSPTVRGPVALCQLNVTRRRRGE